VQGPDPDIEFGFLMMWIRLHLFLGSCYGFDVIHEYVVNNNVDEMFIAPTQFENISMN
jgi:hypothetical protein